ncbi:GxxExxY protein [Enterovirga sp. GCM10030262]|uniref:GxxExxY protein n=1 Tax=Enterovirga sp. GCM10030262 TaxID=3273391 RepID=UPI003610F57D
MKEIDEITGDVLDVALRLHRELGPGLLESVYETLLARRLQSFGYDVVSQQLISAEFEGARFEAAFRADLLVDGRLLIEVKSVERLLPVHSKQLLTYLRLMKQPVGLLINFGGETLKEGIRRVVNEYRPSAPLPSFPRLRVNEPSSGV